MDRHLMVIAGVLPYEGARVLIKRTIAMVDGGREMAGYKKYSEESIEMKKKAYTDAVVRIMSEKDVLLTENEAYHRLNRELYEFTHDFFKENGFILKPADAWEAFEKDYRACKTGNISNQADHGVWLWYDNLPDDSFLTVIGRTADVYGIDIAKRNAIPASAEQKKLYFRMMEATHLPLLDYCRPNPEKEYEPHRTYTGLGNTTSVVIYKCVDDGGLADEENPVGKTYSLKSDMGLRAAVTIVEKREPPFNAFECDKDNYAPLGRYLCKGFVEGYTVFGEDVPDEEIPEIVLRTDKNGKIVKLGICSCSKADLDAFRNFPLWQDYFQSCDEWYEKRKGMILEAARQIHDEAGRPVFGKKRPNQDS